MSTRSVIAYKEKEGWQGVYSHYDGYPTHRGKQIWDIIMQKFILNKGVIGVSYDGSTAIRAFVDIYIKGHKGGWSSFPDVCYCHSPEFVMRDGVREAWYTNKNPDALFIEWVYVIDIENKKMIIYTHGRAKGTHKEKSIDGEREWDSPNYTHYLVREVELNPDRLQPDWQEIEDEGVEISNKMYTKYEDKEKKNG